MEEKIFVPAFYTVPVYMDGELITKLFGTYEVLDALAELYRTAYVNDNDERLYVTYTELTRFLTTIDDEV